MRRKELWMLKEQRRQARRNGFTAASEYDILEKDYHELMQEASGARELKFYNYCYGYVDGMWMEPDETPHFRSLFKRRATITADDLDALQWFLDELRGGNELLWYILAG